MAKKCSVIDCKQIAAWKTVTDYFYIPDKVFCDEHHVEEKEQGKKLEPLWKYDDSGSNPEPISKLILKIEESSTIDTRWIPTKWHYIKGKLELISRQQEKRKMNTVDECKSKKIKKNTVPKDEKKDKDLDELKSTIVEKDAKDNGEEDLQELGSMLSNLCDGYGAWSANGKPKESRDLDYYHNEVKSVRFKYSIQQIQKAASEMHKLREQYLFVKKVREGRSDYDFPMCRDHNAVNMLRKISQSGDIPIFETRHLQLDQDAILNAAVGPCRDFLRTIYFLYSENGQKESKEELEVARTEFTNVVFNYRDLTKLTNSKIFKDLFQHIKSTYPHAYAKHVQGDPTFVYDADETDDRIENSKDKIDATVS